MTRVRNVSKRTASKLGGWTEAKYRAYYRRTKRKDPDAFAMTEDEAWEAFRQNQILWQEHRDYAEPEFMDWYAEPPAGAGVIPRDVSRRGVYDRDLPPGIDTTHTPLPPSYMVAAGKMWEGFTPCQQAAWEQVFFLSKGCIFRIPTMFWDWKIPFWRSDDEREEYSVCLYANAHHAAHKEKLYYKTVVWYVREALDMDQWGMILEWGKAVEVGKSMTEYDEGLWGVEPRAYINIRLDDWVGRGTPIKLIAIYKGDDVYASIGSSSQIRGGTTE